VAVGNHDLSLVGRDLHDAPQPRVFRLGTDEHRAGCARGIQVAILVRLVPDENEIRLHRFERQTEDLGGDTLF